MVTSTVAALVRLVHVRPAARFDCSFAQRGERAQNIDIIFFLFPRLAFNYVDPLCLADHAPTLWATQSQGRPLQVVSHLRIRVGLTFA